MTITIHGLIDDAMCYEMVRSLHWPDGVCCPHCESRHVVKNGHDTSEVCRQRYCRRDCGRCFDDLTGTVFAGHHRPLRTWVLCAYFMGLNLSNRQIAAESGLSITQAHVMTMRLRRGVAENPTPFVLEGEVECDEAYVVAGHKGHPEAVKKRSQRPSTPSERDARPGALEKEKPPIFGMIQRGGRVVMRMLSNGRRKTIRPIVEAAIAPATTVFTDEYDICCRLPAWGDEHRTVCHSRGE